MSNDEVAAKLTKATAELATLTELVREERMAAHEAWEAHNDPERFRHTQSARFNRALKARAALDAYPLPETETP